MDHNEAMRKVAALLKLAERGGTPEEAATAAAKAQEIITKYQLNVDDVDFDQNQAKEDAEEVKDFGFSDPLDDLASGTHYRPAWTSRLASVVASANQCATRCAKNGKVHGAITIRVIGRPSDVQLVRYLYGYFRNQIDALRKQHCAGNSSKFIGEFCTGCVDTLQRKIREQQLKTREEVRQAQSGDARALVRVNNAVARLDKRMSDVNQFIEGHNVQIICGWTGLSADVVKLFRQGNGDDAKKCFPTLAQWREAREAYNSCFTRRRGGGGAGSRTGESGGRAVGQRAGESIQMTGAKSALGSGQKQIN